MQSCQVRLLESAWKEKSTVSIWISDIQIRKWPWRQPTSLRIAGRAKSPHLMERCSKNCLLFKRTSHCNPKVVCLSYFLRLKLHITWIMDMQILINSLNLINAWTTKNILRNTSIDTFKLLKNILLKNFKKLKSSKNESFLS